jgi:hypothetical protein
MAKYLFVLVLSLTAGVLSGQDISELEKRNGFKDIKLGALADSVKGVKFKKDIKESDEFDARQYEVSHPDYSKIGEVEVKGIEIKAYKGLIYEIIVVTAKDTRLMKALESIYGQAEYDIKRETYFWKSNSVTLKFRSHSKHALELIYNSQLVRKMMKEDKGKKVEAIADDF